MVSRTFVVMVSAYPCDLRQNCPEAVQRLFTWCQSTPSTKSSTDNFRRRPATGCASSRDTCICEIPTRSAIWVWVMLPKKRSTRIVRSRSGSSSSSGAQGLAVLDLVQLRVRGAQGVGQRGVRAGHQLVERRAPVGLLRVEPLDDLLGRDAQVRD